MPCKSAVSSGEAAENSMSCSQVHPAGNRRKNAESLTKVLSKSKGSFALCAVGIVFLALKATALLPSMAASSISMGKPSAWAIFCQSNMPNVLFFTFCSKDAFCFSHCAFFSSSPHCAKPLKKKRESGMALARTCSNASAPCLRTKLSGSSPVGKRANHASWPSRMVCMAMAIARCAAFCPAVSPSKQK